MSQYPFPGVYNEAVFRGLDYALDQARQRGLKARDPSSGITHACDQRYCRDYYWHHGVLTDRLWPLRCLALSHLARCISDRGC